STTCEEVCDLLAESQRPGCNCQRTQLGEGMCAEAAPPDMGAGSSCNMNGFAAVYNKCPPGYGCRADTDAWRCWKLCTPDNAHTQCGPCTTCEDVKAGVSVCSWSR